MHRRKTSETLTKPCRNIGGVSCFYRVVITSLNINICTVGDFSSRKKLKELATYIVFKRVYTDGSYHNYSIRSVGKKTKYSNTFIKKYINIFLTNGWCKLDGSNLFFKNLKCLPKGEGKDNLLLDVTGSIKDIVCKLRMILLKRKHNNCLYMKKKKKEIEACLGKDTPIALSMRCISATLSCSKSEASRTLCAANRLGIVKIKRVRKMIGKSLKKMTDMTLFIKTIFDKTQYWYKGEYFKVYCNEYSF